MRGIGEVARASGLSISALRFYDGAGVLVPASVDPVTGYRRYADEQIRSARLVAALRRVGMPVAEIAEAVADPSSVRRLADRHLRRLEDGLSSARRELSRVHLLLDPTETTMTRLTLPAASLAAALDAVRFAACTDPGLPMLGGVLFDAGTDLTLVATDRYRLAVARADATVDGPPQRVLLPLPFLDGLRPFLDGSRPHSDGSPPPLDGSPPHLDGSRSQPDGEVTLLLGRSSVVVEMGGARHETAPVDADFPDHRALLHFGDTRRVAVDPAVLREAAASARRELDGRPYDVLALEVAPDGALRVAPEGEWDERAHVGVNREFLLQALAAGGGQQLTLELDGPIRPLAIRLPDDPDRFSVLMPVRRDPHTEQPTARGAVV